MVNVVYRIPCSTCVSSYVGETKRALTIRMSEHRRHIRKNKPNKVLAIHCNNNNLKHKINWDEVSILDVEQNYWKRRTSEILID